MSTPLWDILKIALLAVLGGLIVSGITQLFRLLFWLVTRGRHMPDAKPRRISLAGVLPSALLGVVIFGLAAYALIMPNPILGECPPLASPNASITSPSDGAAVGQMINVHGIACHLPEGKGLWLIVAAEGVAGYFPQTGPITVSTNDNEWTVSAQLGGLNTPDTGRTFVLYTALADQQGTVAIQGYFASAPDFKPLNPLPVGIQLLNQIQVVRD